MQIFSGTVKYEAGEPYEGNYGPRINVVVENLSDPNMPKAKDGELKLYKKPDSPDGRYMKTLRTGDAVQLVYTDNGSMSYYNFVMDGQSQSSQPRHTTASPPTQGGNTRGSQIWLPMNDEQLVVYTHIAEQELELMAHIMTMVHQRFGEKLNDETLWKASVTVYINSTKKFRPEYVILDDQPDPEPEDYSQVDPEPAELAF